MIDTTLFEQLLEVKEPWYIKRSEFSKEERKIDIYIDFKKGGRFQCPICNEPTSAYDTEEKVWRHLNLFQYETYIHARVPRIKCKQHGVKQVKVPWARKQSGFTLFFESLVMTFAQYMPIQSIAKMIGETDKRIWRVVEHYVHEALEKEDYSTVRKIGIDETAVRRGHEYISLFVDLEKKKVIHVCEGKSSETITTFAEKIKHQKGNPEYITDVSCDMSPAFISGIQESLPKATITFDRFHVMKLMNEAVDKVRKNERKTFEELQKTRYIWLKNPENLTKDQRKTLVDIEKLNLKTVRAYKIKLAFQDIFKQSSENAVYSLKVWYSWAIRSRLKPVIEFAQTVKRHWSGILRWFQSRISNGILEGLNSIVQAAKAKARGFRTFRYLAYCVYLVIGKLNFSLPT